MKNLIKYLWSAFLLTFPFGVRFLVYEDTSYRFGNFNPWVSGFVYLPEVLLLLIFGLWIVNKVRSQESGVRNQHRWLWILFALFAVNAFIVTLIKGDSLLGAMFILRLFEVIIVMWLIADSILKPKQVITLLLFGALLQVAWGFLQWQLNHSLGLTFLGESIISPAILNVAKTDLVGGLKQIRAYGTFLHPNIFAGYLLIILFLSIKYLRSVSKIFWPAIIICGLYLTGSRAAILVGLVGVMIYLLDKYKIKYLRIFRLQFGYKIVASVIILSLAVGNAWFFYNSYAVKTTDSSFKERLSQNVISKDMIKAQPFGVGVGNFTLEMETYSGCGAIGGADCGANSGAKTTQRSDALQSVATPNSLKLSPWEFQPVHNTYFLILNEVGIQGLLLFVAFLVMLIGYYWKSGKAIPIFILLVLASFDHFLWDSFVGMMLIGLVAGFFVVEGCLDHDLHD